jgi:DNA-directed RNA polymerase subunit M/transcription elongation factor TFIIS
MAKVNIGKMGCETCGNHVTVKENENGTLSYRCDECDAAPYAKTGTLQNTRWREKAGVSPQKTAAPKPVESVKNTPPMDTPKTPEKKPSSNMWGL